MTCTTSRKRKLEKRPRKLMMRRWLRATISPPSTHRNGPKLFDRTSLATSAHILVTDVTCYSATWNLTPRTVRTSAVCVSEASRRSPLYRTMSTCTMASSLMSASTVTAPSLHLVSWWDMYATSTRTRNRTNARSVTMRPSSCRSYVATFAVTRARGRTSARIAPMRLQTRSSWSATSARTLERNRTSASTATCVSHNPTHWKLIGSFIM